MPRWTSGGGRRRFDRTLGLKGGRGSGCLLGDTRVRGGGMELVSREQWGSDRRLWAGARRGREGWRRERGEMMGWFWGSWRFRRVDFVFVYLSAHSVPHIRLHRQDCGFTVHFHSLYISLHRKTDIETALNHFTESSFAQDMERCQCVQAIHAY